uniref:Putative secreted peptide n=1 Tax=Anopheles braziliensis TaxID=58242 RepID=A0A2M3ZQX5_9DIPT
MNWLVARSLLCSALPTGGKNACPPPFLAAFYTSILPTGRQGTRAVRVASSSSTMRRGLVAYRVRGRFHAVLFFVTAKR